MKKILLTASLCLLILSLKAQYSFETFNQGHDTIKVIEGQRTLSMPFAGGFDVPQFAECDLDLDGKLDLVVYDREGERLTTFLNKGTTNTIKYEYAPQYIKRFPQIADWLQMVDYNGDGKMDIVTSIPGGARVYKNISDNNVGLKFENNFPDLQCDYGTFITRLYIGNIDIPAVLDVDDDGDIDILTFYTSIDTSGESIFWYKNMSMERYGIKDSMEFVIGKFCWGKFRESFTDCRIKLNDLTGPCGTNGRFLENISKDEFTRLMNNSNKTSNGGAHSGSTNLVFDANGDGKKDMLIGDVTCNNMYLVVNNTDNIAPVMNQTINHFPPNHPIVLELFPAAYLADVNNDGLKDIIASTNTSNASKNTNHIQLYLNNGLSTLDRFDFETDYFLNDEMIDVADGSSPAFVDYNNDGLLDLVISNTGYWISTSVNQPGLALYKNIGTTSLAKYELVTRDWFNFSNLNIANLNPTFGDIDNDGDVDMVCGAQDGTLHYFQNNAGSGNSMNLQYIPNFFGGIDVGNFSSPSLYDFNNDGKIEIIVGERFDNINLFENTGTLSNPIYTLTTDSLYKINLKNFSGYPTGRSKLTIQQLVPNDSPRVIVSNANGMIFILDYVSNDYTKSMTTAVDTINLYAGEFSNSGGGFNFSFADLNNDQKPELVVGTPQGGIFLYRNTSNSVGISNEKRKTFVKVFPNPAKEKIFIQSENNSKIISLKLIDLSGKILANNNVNNSHYQLLTSGFSSGMYLIQLLTDKGIEYHKIVIEN